MTNVFGLNGRTWIALTGPKTSRAKMSTGKVYKQAIRRVFAEKYHDERTAYPVRFAQWASTRTAYR
jgi:hypothetical protein